RLAGLYLSVQRPELAREVLLGGLVLLHRDADYVGSTFRFLSEQQDDAQILQQAEVLLGSHLDATIQPIVAFHAASAAWQWRGYAVARDFIAGSGLAASPEGAVLQARVDWARGLPELAISHLAASLQSHPDNLPALQLLADFYRQLNRLDDWQTSLAAQLAA